MALTLNLRALLPAYRSQQLQQTRAIQLQCSREAKSRLSQRVSSPTPLVSQLQGLPSSQSSASFPPSRSVAPLRALGNLAEPAPGERSQVSDSKTHPLVVPLLDMIQRLYLERNPTSSDMLQRLANKESASDLEPCPWGSWAVPSDHFAFRTFGVEGFGITSLEKVFKQLGYERRDRLEFPGKKLQAYWYAPPPPPTATSSTTGSTVSRWFLPRIFISEIKVHELSAGAQSIILRYLESEQARAMAGVDGGAQFCSFFGVLPWATPTAEDYNTLAEESEYAAWTLANGYALNHTTVSVHNLATIKSLDEFNSWATAQGWRLNPEGGVIKVSPDGLLRQSSTVADVVQDFAFACGTRGPVVRSYIEFAERLALPQFSHLLEKELAEGQRRDGFETSNADGIFESTSLRNAAR